MAKKLHPAWTALVVTFITLMATAGFRSAPSILIVPLEDAFGWSRSEISLAIAINVMLYGLIAPFAAALMERFTVRKVVMTALSFVAISSGSTIFMTQPWHLWALWGVCVGVGTGSMALVFAATIANRWFIARKGIVVGALTAAGATGQLIFLPVLSHLAITYGWKSVSLTVAGACVVVVPLLSLIHI
jgi:MFS family permease